MKELIEKYCYELKLGKSVAENYLNIMAETHEEFLAKLLGLEVERRELNRKSRYLKQANFDVFKTFDGYTFQDIQIPASISLENIKTTRFIQSKENLILYGPVGTGKTHLVTAHGVEACNRNQKVKFFRTAALVNTLIEAKASGTLNKLLK